MGREKVMKRCRVCGKEYESCYVCEKQHSWRMLCETEDHYFLLRVLMDYAANKDARLAADAIEGRGISLTKTAEYLPSVRSLMAEIHERVTPVVKAKPVFIEPVELGEAEEIDVEEDE